MENAAVDRPKVTPALLRGPAEQLKAVLGEDVSFDGGPGDLHPGGPCWFCGKEPPVEGLACKQNLVIREDTGEIFGISVNVPRCGRCARAHS